MRMKQKLELRLEESANSPDANQDEGEFIISDRSTIKCVPLNRKVERIVQGDCSEKNLVKAMNREFGIHYGISEISYQIGDNVILARGRYNPLLRTNDRIFNPNARFPVKYGAFKGVFNMLNSGKDPAQQDIVSFSLEDFPLTDKKWGNWRSLIPKEELRYHGPSRFLFGEHVDEFAKILEVLKINVVEYLFYSKDFLEDSSYGSRFFERVILNDCLLACADESFSPLVLRTFEEKRAFLSTSERDSLGGFSRDDKLVQGKALSTSLGFWRAEKYFTRPTFGLYGVHYTF